MKPHIAYCKDSKQWIAKQPECLPCTGSTPHDAYYNLVYWSARLSRPDDHDGTDVLWSRYDDRTPLIITDPHIQKACDEACDFIRRNF